MIKEAYYFSHDSNARTDPKIMAMIKNYGIEGYGRFWIIIETLSEQLDYKLKLCKWSTNALAMAMLCEANDVEKFINDCLEEFELLETDGEYFWSNSLKKRMDLKEKKRQQKVEAGKKGANTRWKDSKEEAPLKQSDGDAITEHGKGKESKVKESKRNENNKTSSPKSKTYDEDSVFYQLAFTLQKRIKQNNPKAKEPNLQSWADIMRLMIERDNRTEHDIKQVIDWCQEDDFWQDNILSAKKLREKFDQLYVKMKKGKKTDTDRRSVPPSESVLGQRVKDWDGGGYM